MIVKELAIGYLSREVVTSTVTKLDAIEGIISDLHWIDRCSHIYMMPLYTGILY